ncbi:MAG: hypothetical protein CJBNEKGG_04220 [Prosthecobacter sp.]|nr:hypothetical protein [Prosthecobacter sp.]
MDGILLSKPDPAAPMLRFTSSFSSLASALLLVAPLVLPLQSSSLAGEVQAWKGRADITFSGTSTLHDWSGRVAAQPFITRVTTDSGGRPARVQSSVKIEAAGMDTDEPRRDENMHKAMKAAEHPLITAEIDVPAGRIASDLKTPTQLPMTLTLLGRPLQVTAVVSSFKQQDGGITFDLDFPLSMKAGGISVPSVLYFIRVGDVVKIHASVTLTQN